MTLKAALPHFLASLLWLCACSRPPTVANPPTPTPAPVVLTGQADGAPGGCGVSEVGQRLVDFTGEFNARDAEAVLAFFNSAAPFAWYSAPDANPQGHIAVYSTDDLPSYFEQRYAQNETLQFTRIDMNGWDAARGLVHFDFSVKRQADDLNDGLSVEVVGKGAFHCRTQSFVVISIGSAAS